MNGLYKTALLLGSSLGLLPTAAIAQQAPQATSEEGEIVVTGTRIRLEGYQAPTPVTVLPIENLLKAAPSDLTDSLRTMPQFQNTDSYRQGTGGDTRPKGNFLNLRGLGSNRTLIMFDGVRMSPTNYTATVNVDVLPQILVDRVDVVTAGASAAYGSDAVSGVVNFVLDKKFKGIKGVLQGGVSERGDAEHYRVGIAGGFDLTERLHVMASFEQFDQSRLEKKQRPIRGDTYQDFSFVGKTPNAGPPGSAINPFVAVDNARLNVFPPTGLFNTGPFAGLVLNSDGTTRPYDFGTPSGTSGTSLGGDGLVYGNRNGTGFLVLPLLKRNAFARVDFEASDAVNLYVQGIYSRANSYSSTSPSPLIFARLFSGNPFLPQALQAQLGPNDSFFYSTFLTDPEDPHRMTFKDRFFQGQAGANGSFGENWEWHVDYVYGRSRGRVSIGHQLQVRQTLAAMDAVRDPATGNVVCRITLTNPGVLPGCVPFNILGVEPNRNITPAIDAYVFDDLDYTYTVPEHNISASISGELFELPAGPVSVAFGAGYRASKLGMTSDSDSVNIPDSTGLRGFTAVSANPATSSIFFYQNVVSGRGSINVKEAFAEVAVPVLADISFAHQLDVNGAVRFTDYSSSGRVVTWKLGATYEPVDGVRFRLTRSRDIRAPSLYDLFAGRIANVSNVVDPHTNRSLIAPVIQQGNPNLEPEVARTLTFGVAVYPKFLPGFRATVDYYKISIDNAISVLGASAILDNCEIAGGTGPICDLITRPLPFSDRSPANVPTSISQSPVNATLFSQKGIDFEAGYRFDAIGGNIDLRLLANVILDAKQQLSPIVAPIPTAGYTENQGRPNWRGTLSASYTKDNWSFFMQGRYIGKLKFGPQNVYEHDDVPAVVYVDATVSYKTPIWGADSELFFTVNNLLDKKPPIVPQDGTVPGIFYPTSRILYDTIWRSFTAGLRFRL